MSWDIARILEFEASTAAEKCRVLQVSFQDQTPDEILTLIPQLRSKLKENLEVSEDLANKAEVAKNIDLEVQSSDLPDPVKEAIRKFDQESLTIILNSGIIDSSMELRLITEQLVHAVFDLGLDPMLSLDMIERACNLISDTKYGSFQFNEIKKYKHILKEPLPIEDESVQES